MCTASSVDTETRIQKEPESTQMFFSGTISVRFQVALTTNTQSRLNQYPPDKKSEEFRGWGCFKRHRKQANVPEDELFEHPWISATAYFPAMLGPKMRYLSSGSSQLWTLVLFYSYKKMSAFSSSNLISLSEAIHKYEVTITWSAES